MKNYAVTYYSEATYTIVVLAVVRNAPSAMKAWEAYEKHMVETTGKPLDSKGLGVTLLQDGHKTAQVPVINYN